MAWKKGDELQPFLWQRIITYENDGIALGMTMEHLGNGTEKMWRKNWAKSDGSQDPFP